MALHHTVAGKVTMLSKLAIVSGSEDDNNKISSSDDDDDDDESERGAVLHVVGGSGGDRIMLRLVVSIVMHIS